MDVTFATRRLERAYADFRLATREWGDAVGRKYIQRIEVIRAANAFEDLFSFRALRLHPLKGEHAGKHAMTVHDRWRLIVKSTGSTVDILEVTNHYGD